MGEHLLDGVKHRVPELASAVLGLHKRKGGLSHALAHLPLRLHDFLQDLPEPADPRTLSVELLS